MQVGREPHLEAEVHAGDNLGLLRRGELVDDHHGGGDVAVGHRPVKEAVAQELLNVGPRPGGAHGDHHLAEGLALPG